MYRNLIANPITKESIRQTNGLGNLSILRYHQGTNFPVTPDRFFATLQNAGELWPLTASERNNNKES